MNGVLFFTANDGTNGEELWKSDGTAQGTVLVKDLRPGKYNLDSTKSLTNVGGTLFFLSNDGAIGEELWKSDGTTGGTVLVKDIRSGAIGANISELAAANGSLYFRANDGSTGDELWKSDGTSTGTVLLKEIRAGTFGSNPSNLTNVNGTLFFQADNLTNGIELWKSDGSGAGTVLVKDIEPGPFGSRVSGPNGYPSGTLANVNGLLYFSANTSASGDELWKSDGTASGTVLAMDIFSGTGSSFPTLLTALGSRVVFPARSALEGNELWISNEAPVLTRANASVTGNVLTQLANTGTWSDPESGAVTLSASLGTVTKNSDGTWSWTHTPSVALLNQVVTISADDGTNVSSVTFSVTANTTIATRGLVYMGATGASASTSLATDKSALLPGQASTFANYTNYSLGLNGLVFDVVGLPATVTETQLALCLQFANWDGIAAAGFVALPGAAAPTVSIVSGGVVGSTRVRVTFLNNSLQNTWLRVTVLANADTALAANDVFYFGNVIGDLNIGNTPSRLRVNGQDTGLLLLNQSAGINSANVTNIFDLNRDGRVNGLDTGILLANQQAGGIVAPITAPSSFGRQGGRVSGGEGEARFSAAPMPSEIPKSAYPASSNVDGFTAVIGPRWIGENYEVPRVNGFLGNKPTYVSHVQEMSSPITSTEKKQSPEEPWISPFDSYFAKLGLDLEETRLGSSASE